MLLISPLASGTPDGPRLGRFQPFDSGWRFRFGTAEGCEETDFDDSSWRRIDIPHDWSIEDLRQQSSHPQGQIVGPFDRNAEGGTATGFSRGGEGWYRKRFRLEAPPQGRVEILFEGVYMNSAVWINGQYLGTHEYGYTPFAYDLTPHLSREGKSVIAVRVRNLGRNSRWYCASPCGQSTQRGASSAQTGLPN
jgi:beta-galactosidase